MIIVIRLLTLEVNSGMLLTNNEEPIRGISLTTDKSQHIFQFNISF